MQIAACKPYHARLAGKKLLRMPDGRSVFKLYFLSIVGRDQPERYEWQRSPLRPEAFEQKLLSAPLSGVGFIIAFPHVCKVFRFSPQGETTLDVLEFNTPDLSARDSTRGDGSHEFACYAEAVIAADEYLAWAAAASVTAYLESFSAAEDFPVAENQKLARYWQTK